MDRKLGRENVVGDKFLPRYKSSVLYIGFILPLNDCFITNRTSILKRDIVCIYV